MSMNRRGFLKSILAAGVAPAVVGSGVLMPVRKIFAPPAFIGIDPAMGRDSTAVVFRRYGRLPLPTGPLIEGITPTWESLTVVDYIDVSLAARIGERMAEIADRIRYQAIAGRQWI